jgi:hypothetical protein
MCSGGSHFPFTSMSPLRHYSKVSSLCQSILYMVGEDFNDDVVGFFLKYADDHLKKELEVKKMPLRSNILITTGL